MSTLLEAVLREALAQEHEVEVRHSLKHVVENEDTVMGLLTKLVGPQAAVEAT